MEKWEMRKQERQPYSRLQSSLRSSDVVPYACGAIESFRAEEEHTKQYFGNINLVVTVCHTGHMVYGRNRLQAGTLCKRQCQKSRYAANRIVV